MRAVVPLSLATAILIPTGACGGSEKPAPAAPTPSRTYADTEDEPDDGLELVSARGHMDPADVTAGLAPHSAGLEDCYKSRLGKRRWLGGKVELKWEISADGVLKSAQVASSDLGAWPVEKCLLELARTMSFAKPKGGDADFTVPLEFSARGATQWWDEEQSTRAVGGHPQELAGCAGEIGDPADVVVTVYVGTRGKVQSVGFASTAQPIPDVWAECAATKVMAWQLVDPRGAVAKATFTYNAGGAPLAPSATAAE